MTDATDWLMIALGILLTAGTALFVSGEFSLVALPPRGTGAPPRSARR